MTSSSSSSSSSSLALVNINPTANAEIGFDSIDLDAKHLSISDPNSSSPIRSDHKGYTNDMLSVSREFGNNNNPDSSSPALLDAKDDDRFSSDRSTLDSKSIEENNKKEKGPLSISVARPHHLPKSDSLSSKLDEIRRNMALQGGEEEAPWDASGKPIKKKKSKKDKKSSYSLIEENTIEFNNESENNSFSLESESKS